MKTSLFTSAIDSSFMTRTPQDFSSRLVLILGRIVSLILFLGFVIISQSNAEALKVAMMPSYLQSPVHGNAAINIPLDVWGRTWGGTPPYTYSLDFGDGTPVVSGTAADPDFISASHSYTAAGTKTATLTVTDFTGLSINRSSTIRVFVAPVLQEKVNMATEKALIYLYKRRNAANADSLYWNSTGYSDGVGTTGAVILSFEENGHLPTNDYEQDIYAETVHKGLNWLLTNGHGNYQTLSAHTDGVAVRNEYTSGNGKGAYLSTLTYSNALANLAVIAATRNKIDAQNRIVASGTFAGVSYYDLGVDFLDQWAFCQSDNFYRGGWRYSMTSASESLDGSAQQWPILVFAAATDRWGLRPPQWVVDNAVNGYQLLKNANGAAGYSSNSEWLNSAKTGGMLVSFAYAGKGLADPDVEKAINFIGSVWRNQGQSGSSGYSNGGWASGWYDLYSVKKGLQLQGVTMVTTPDGPRNWADDHAAWLLGDATLLDSDINPSQRSLSYAFGQNNDGSWTSWSWPTNGGTELMTAGALLSLNRSVTEALPVALITQVTDRPPGLVSFEINGGNSYHQDPGLSIVEYLWDWDASDGVNWAAPDASGPRPTHPGYLNTGAYTVTLRVKDNDTPASTAVSSTIITIKNGDVPPVAVAIPANRRPAYTAAIGAPILLDGSESYDPNGDAITLYEWDTDGDGQYDDAVGATTTLTLNAEIQRTVGLRVTANGVSSTNLVPLDLYVSSTDLVLSEFTAQVANGFVQTQLMITNHASSGKAFNGVQVRLYDGDPLGNGAAVGSFKTVDLPSGASVPLVFSDIPATGLTKLFAYVDSAKAIPENNEVNNIRSVDIATNDTVLQGLVTHAVTGLPLPGVRVAIGGLSTITDADGNYRIENIPAAVLAADFDSDVRSGNAPLTVNFRNLTTRNRHLLTGTREGFSPYENSIALVAGETRNLAFSMSPLLNADEMRLVLNWGQNPSDLDSHLVTPQIDGLVRHVYYVDEGALDRAPYAQLDVDDTNSYGPETITISRFFPGVYHYYIHLYSGSGSLMTSEAVVNLYGSTGLLRTLEAPTAGSGIYWHVATIDGTTGAIQLINQISDSPTLPQAAMNGVFASAAQSIAEEQITYQWEFGDGTTSSESDPEHVYQSPGVYSVKLTATQGAEVAVRTRAEYITVTGPPPAPEIVVEEPVGMNLVDGVATLAFGNSNIGTPVIKTLTVRNTGNADLSGLVVAPSGANDFTVGALGSTTLAAGASTQFTVTFTPTAAGPRNASLQIANNDADENPFDIALSGNGVAANPYDLTFVGTPYELRVGNQVAFDLKRLLAPGETLKVGGKLPSGLKFNATTGLLTGIISGKPGTFAASIQILQGKTVLRTIAFPITVLEFPPTLIGNFNFIMEDADLVPIGVCKITITGPNRWSATLESAGASKKRSAKGAFILAEGSPVAPIIAVFPAITGAPVVTVDISIDGSTPSITGTYDEGTLRGFRLAKVGEMPVATVAYSLILYAGEQDGIDIPAGLGWMKGTVSNKGIGTFKGLLGDGTTATITLGLSAFGQAVLWSQPYKNKSSYIGGIVTLDNLGQTTPDEPPLTDEVWWSKSADAKTLSYPDGFPGILVTVGTSRWTAPASATALGSTLGWRDNRKTEVYIYGGGLDNQEPQFTSAALPTEFTLDDKYALIRSLPVAPPLVVWKGKVSKTDGAMSGTLTLPVGFSSDFPSGSAAASGMLVQGEQWESVTGCGQIKVPAPGPKGSFRTAAFVLGQ